jgi:hypothetical protein
MSAFTLLKMLSWQLVYEDGIYSLYYYYVLLNLKIWLSPLMKLYIYMEEIQIFESLKETSV